MPNIVPDYQAGTYQILDKLTGKVIRRISQLDLAADFAELRPEIAATYVAAVMVGSEAVGYFSVEQYNQLREAAGITDRFEAELLDLDLDQVREQARRIAYQALRLDDAEAVGREVAGKMAQAVRNHGFDTTAHNIGRDPKMVGVNSRYTITLTCNERQCGKKNKPEWQCANVAEAIKNLAPATAHSEAEKPDHWFHENCRCHIQPNWSDGHARLGGVVKGKVQYAPHQASGLEPTFALDKWAESHGIPRMSDFTGQGTPARVNPDYAGHGESCKSAKCGNCINCQRVVFAKELQMRGYDVRALPNPKDTDNRWGEWDTWMTGLSERLEASTHYILAPGESERVRGMLIQEIEKSEQNVGRMQSEGAKAHFRKAAQAGRDALANFDKLYTEDVYSHWQQLAADWEDGERGIIGGYARGHVWNVIKRNGELVADEAQLETGQALKDYAAETEANVTRFLTLKALDADRMMRVAKISDLDFNDGALKAITWNNQ